MAKLNDDMRRLSVVLPEALKARIKTAAILSGLSLSEFCTELFTEATEHLVQFQAECRKKYQYGMIDRALEGIEAVSFGEDTHAKRS